MLESSGKKDRHAARIKEARRQLDENGIYYEMPNPTHIKMFDINYYPTKGTIHIDRESGAREERGIEALLRLLRARMAPDLSDLGQVVLSE